MEKTETQKLQMELKALLKEQGWSLKKLAIEFSASDESRSEDRDDPNLEYERLRKALRRSSTKPQTLHRYINFVIETENAKRNQKGCVLYKIPHQDLSQVAAEQKAVLEEVGRIASRFFQEQEMNA